MLDLFTSSNSNSSAQLLPIFDLDSYRDKNYLTHNVHPYPAKFVPQIPRLLIERLCPVGGVVLDPFCGSGTSLLEAVLSARNAIGVDLNPLAVRIARVKSTKLSRLEIEELEDFLNWFRSSNEKQNLTDFFIPEFRNRRKWFSEIAAQELAQIKGAIDSVETKIVRDVLVVCFSAIIVKASNQESDTRWKAIEKDRKKGETLEFFTDKVAGTIKRFAELSLVTKDEIKCQVLETNAKNLMGIADQSIDFLVTSPPYMNSFDYYLYHKLRMFWLGFDHYPVQEQEIGSRNKHCDEGLGIGHYEEEMFRTMSEASRVLKHGAYAAYVIGDSVYKDQIVRMDEIYSRIAEKARFDFVEKFSYEQRRYTRSFRANYKTHKKKTHILLFRAR